MKLEHIGIAVNDLTGMEETLTKVLGIQSYKKEIVESEGVLTSFFKVGDAKVELVTSTNTDAALHKYLEKNGNGLHHIAFNCESLDAELSRLQMEGFEVIKGYPRPGADNKRVAFLHPRGTGKILIELCEDISEAQ